MGDHNASLEPADVDAIHAPFPATHLITPTQDDVNDTTHAPFVRTFRKVEMRQVTEVHANARQHGPDDGRASAALGLVLVTKKLMGVKSARGAKKLTMGEFNDRTSMLERKAWDEIRALVDAAVSPAESRVPATAQGHVGAAVTQAERAMAKAKLGTAHGHLASKAVAIQLRSGFHEHLDSGNYGEHNVSTDRRLDEVLFREHDAEAARSAAWKTKVGSAPGADGTTRVDLLNVSGTTRTSWAEIILNGILPGGVGRCGAVIAGGRPFASDKPGKPPTEVQMLMAQSHIARMVGNVLVEENKDDLRTVVGPHQSSFKVKNGPELVALNVGLHHERCENPHHAQDRPAGCVPQLGPRCGARRLPQGGPVPRRLPRVDACRVAHREHPRRARRRADVETLSCAGWSGAGRPPRAGDVPAARGRRASAERRHVGDNDAV